MKKGKMPTGFIFMCQNDQLGTVQYTVKCTDGVSLEVNYRDAVEGVGYYCEFFGGEIKAVFRYYSHFSN